jgi:hypothetical protein
MTSTAAIPCGRTARLLTAAALAALLSGCVTAREQEAAVKPEIAHQYLEDKPAELKRHFLVTLAQGQRNRVLNDERLGLASFEMGNYALSEQLFDDALQGIEAVYADNEAAQKARQLFVKELSKDFKGEPYERAMAYYYRGLLYLRAGDYDNARASFKGGMLQDSFAEDEKYRADFGLMAFLQGWSARCGGNASLAAEDFKEFREINKDFPLPGDKDDVLVLVETGGPPVKYSAADAGSTKPRYLKFRRATATETAEIGYTDTTPPPPALPVKGKQQAKPSIAPPSAVARTLTPALLEDIYYQATTRGGREFDSILAGKAQFKAGANTVGNVALVGAAAAATVAMNSGNRQTQRDSAAAAGVLLLVAIAAKAAAEAAEPDADTRYWDNLPDRVHGLTLALPAGVDKLAVQFYSPSHEPVRGKEAAVTRAGRCGLAWVRAESAFPHNPRAPFTAPPDQMFKPVEIPPLPASPAPVVTSAGMRTTASPNGDKE